MSRLMSRTGRRVFRLALAVAAAGALLAATAPGAGATPGPSAYPEYWFDQWGVSQAWADGDRGQGVTVAVVDTGVQASIAELQASIVPGTDLTGLGGNGEIDRSTDPFSHGTAMASLIVAQGGDDTVVGVAPDAKVMPIAIPLIGTDNTRPDADETATAIRYAADHGAKIINMSFGGERIEGSDPTPCPTATQSAVFYAMRKGAILVASAGNSGLKGSPVEEPSVCLGVISVAAVDAAGQRATFSSTHPYLTVAAPGVNVVSLAKAEGSVFRGDGTSQASALTSGALALIWSAYPQDSNRMIVARLMAGLRDAGPVGRDVDYGYGIVNAGASIGATVTAASPNPVYAAADPFLKQLAGGGQKALAVPPAAATSGSLGAYRRESPPAQLERRTLGGFGIALLGLLGLIVLFVVRPRRR